MGPCSACKKVIEARRLVNGYCTICYKKLTGSKSAINVSTAKPLTEANL
jgi:hypothetical protein